MPIRRPAKLLKGRSFDVSELVLIRNWAAANGVRVTVRLDHGSDTEEYEEVLAFYRGDSAHCGWIMWRSARAVFLQPLIGRGRRCVSVAEAFEAMLARQRPVADVKAQRWPA